MRSKKNTIERWKQIPGWEGVYSASTFGCYRREKPARHAKVGHVSKGYLSKRGGYNTTLSDGSRQVKYGVDQLILKTFVGTCPRGYECNHRDGNKANNHLENLEYVTRKENREQAAKMKKKNQKQKVRLHRLMQVVSMGPGLRRLLDDLCERNGELSRSEMIRLCVIHEAERAGIL
jgi:hypothetical protein